MFARASKPVAAAIASGLAVVSMVAIGVGVYMNWKEGGHRSLIYVCTA